MNINWKISAVFAGLALLVSVISGIIGSVGFGLLILRAILGTTIFGLIGAGVSILISKFLPELMETNAVPAGDKESADEEEIASGNEINIVLPDENPHIAASGEAGDDDGIETLETVEDEAEPINEIESAERGEPGPETLEPSYEAISAKVNGGEDSFQSGELISDELVEEVEEVSPSEDGSDFSSGDSEELAPMNDFRVEGVDALPDISSLSGSDAAFSPSDFSFSAS